MRGRFSLVFILICIFFLSCGKQKQETGQEYLRLMPAGYLSLSGV